MDPSREFPVVIDKLLEPIGLSSAHVDISKLQSVLCSVSLNQQLAFVIQMEVMTKQMGVLLRAAIPHLSTILIQGVIKLIKVFLQGDIEEQDLQKQALIEDENDEEEDGEDVEGKTTGTIHYNARK